MTEQEGVALLQKYRERTISDAERAALMAAVRSGELEALVRQDIWAQLESPSLSVPEWTEEKEAAALAAILQAVNQPDLAPMRRLAWRRWAVAASVVLLASLGGYLAFLKQTGPGGTPASVQPLASDARPGGNKAILTLADGRQIVLDTAASGPVARQGRSLVVKHNGQVDYRAGNRAENGGNDLVFNTLSTPRGGQYQLTLPDGTRVWLNAASAITYPTAFTAKARVVDLTGEAYLEVAQQREHPFIVRLKNGRVTVLGTSMNINAYEEEGVVRTTLVTGSVKFNASGGEKLLAPGQQAVYQTVSQHLTVTDADVITTIAWKNGLFLFNQTDLGTLLRQVARWYDVGIDYQTHIYDTRRFGGGIRRNLRLSSVLALLQTNGVHYQFDGKKITIIP